MTSTVIKNGTIVTHDLTYKADVLIAGGRIVEIGPAEQICTAPREAYTRSLISAVPSPDPRQKRMLHRTRFVA